MSCAISAVVNGKAFADAFRAIMLAFIVATLLVPLLRKVGCGARAERERALRVAEARRDPRYKRLSHATSFSICLRGRSFAVLPADMDNGQVLRGRPARSVS